MAFGIAGIQVDSTPGLTLRSGPVPVVNDEDMTESYVTRDEVLILRVSLLRLCLCTGMFSLGEHAAYITHRFVCVARSADGPLPMLG